MALVKRRWYVYNCGYGWGGQHTAQNYNFVNDFPNVCQCQGNNICAVLGIYSENLGGVPVTYGNNPKTFSADPTLDSYITDALASGNCSPSYPKPYVYVRYC